ncbi:hypothetical protein RclHR1_03430003 [Rhizophagus clarus]|uniref:Serine-threonine/tyrosine-protein kinase catalytic domain-containing protein n=1 Tax=Rhizophagus clarus TaxID=94130 RepID=A0A2Z6RDV0_9GLOM|nr:hypothetical protein RclHR1_03430003 [Rhizophagus clarus]
MKTLRPDSIAEWIPYNNLQDVKYLTKGGCSEIYTMVWIDGHYKEWDLKEKQLERFGWVKVALKKLENIESSNKNWFEEGISHLHLSSKSAGLIVQCFGLTQNPLNRHYMLVLRYMDINLREYLNQNHNKLTWKIIFQIIDHILYAVSYIHKENVCGPADILLNSIYLICIVMWEISSGQPPFINKHNYNLVIKIVNGMRPKIILGTPLEYKELMVKCWDASPTKRRTRNIQYDFDLQDNSIIVEEKSNKRIYFNDDEKDLTANSNKRVKSNNNEGNCY